MPPTVCLEHRRHNRHLEGNSLSYDKCRGESVDGSSHFRFAPLLCCRQTANWILAVLALIQDSPRQSSTLWISNLPGRLLGRGSTKLFGALPDLRADYHLTNAISAVSENPRLGSYFNSHCA